MGQELSLAQGKSLIKLARKSLEYALASGQAISETCKDKALLEKRGVFATLHTFPKRELRGCIGYPYPVKPLWEAVAEAAVEAGIHDPRFPPMKSNELENVILELSVLTKPEEIKGDRKTLPKMIEIGKDGLIVQRGYRSGLLLSQVATQQGWDAQTFLEECCAKAGLSENIWQSSETRVLKFQAQIFSETAPGKEVEEKD